MPVPTPPSVFRELIQDPTLEGTFCEDFTRSLDLPKRVWEYVSYVYNEDGSFTDEFKADFCALECKCGDQPGGPGTGVPINVVASDGQFTDRVRVTWDGVTGATEYRVFRNTSNDFATATQIGTTASAIFNDTTAEPGQIYSYWVQSVDSSGTVSGRSTSDTGYRSAAIDAVTDLQASRGMGGGITSGVIHLVWSPPAQTVDTWDIYVGTVDDFDSASRVDMDRSPFNNAASSNPCPVLPCDKPIFVNNGADYYYAYTPRSGSERFVKLYFWVVGKKKDGAVVTGTTGESNSAFGWSEGFGTGETPLFSGVLSIGTGTPEGVFDVAVGATKAYIVLVGFGASGAGGSLSRPGGGGGGGAMSGGGLVVVGGSKFKLVWDASAPVVTLAETSAADAADTRLQYSADGTFGDTIDVLECLGAEGGKYDAGGDGLGGFEGTATDLGQVTDAFLKDGTNGDPAVTATQKGGRSGRAFGSWRTAEAHFRPFPQADWPGLGSRGSGGGGSHPGNYGYTGGRGSGGFAFIYVV